MKLIVVADNCVYDGVWALRAGHVITMTEWDHNAQTMTVWVEKGEGYVETSWRDFPSWENVV